MGYGAKEKKKHNLPNENREHTQKKMVRPHARTHIDLVWGVFV